MSKTLGGFLLGVFAGALVYEIVQRGKPELIEKVREWASGCFEDSLEREEEMAE